MFLKELLPLMWHPRINNEDKSDTETWSEHRQRGAAWVREMTLNKSEEDGEKEELNSAKVRVAWFDFC